MIRQYIGATLRILALIGLMSLFIALTMISIGVFIGNIFNRSVWLVKARGVLRLVLVSAGTSIQVFVMDALFLFHFSRLQPQPSHSNIIFWSAFFYSMPLGWLLVARNVELMFPQNKILSRANIGIYGLRK